MSVKVNESLLTYEQVKVFEQAKKKNTVDFASIGDLLSATSSIASSSTSLVTSDNIETYIANPASYADKLRAISDSFYITNGIYRNVINAFANLPTLDNIILPSSRTLQRTQDKSYGTYFDKVNAYADSINIKLTTRNILRSVAKYGAYIGYERSNASEYYYQTLPLDYCRIRFKIGQDYQIEFDFKYFDKFFSQETSEFAWEMYPPEFQKLYNAYKKDTKSSKPQWQMLDISKTVVILPDDDYPYFVPIYSGMFESLMNEEEYKDLVKIGEKLDISKLLIQKVPTDDNGNILVPKEFVTVMHNNLKNILPDGASGLTTPFDIEAVTFTNTQQSKEELLSKAERGSFVSSGYSSSMFADNGGHTGLQINTEVVTANIYAILEKIEDLFARKFKNVVNSKNYEFKLMFYRTTNVNIQENFDRMFQLVSIGGAIQPLFSLTGIPPEAYITLLQVEQDLGIKDLLVIPQSMHTQNASTTEDTGGSPTKAESKLTDAGAKQRNLDTNNNSPDSSTNK